MSTIGRLRISRKLSDQELKEFLEKFNEVGEQFGWNLGKSILINPRTGIITFGSMDYEDEDKDWLNSIVRRMGIYFSSLGNNLNGIIGYYFDDLDRPVGGTTEEDDLGDYGYIVIENNEIVSNDFQKRIEKAIEKNDLTALSKIVDQLQHFGINDFSLIFNYIEYKYHSDEKYYPMIKYLVEHSVENANFSHITFPKHNLEFLRFAISHINFFSEELTQLISDEETSPEIRDYVKSLFDEDPFAVDPLTGINNLMIATAQGLKDRIHVYYIVVDWEKVNNVDILGNTVLHYAAKNGQWMNFKDLMVLYADITIKNKKGKVALDYFSDYYLIKMACLWYNESSGTIGPTDTDLKEYISHRLGLHFGGLDPDERFELMQSDFKKRMTLIKGTYLSPEIVPRDILNLVGEMLF